MYMSFSILSMLELNKKFIPQEVAQKAFGALMAFIMLARDTFLQFKGMHIPYTYLATKFEKLSSEEKNYYCVDVYMCSSFCYYLDTTMSDILLETKGKRTRFALAYFKLLHVIICENPLGLGNPKNLAASILPTIELLEFYIRLCEKYLSVPGMNNMEAIKFCKSKMIDALFRLRIVHLQPENDRFKMMTYVRI